MTVLLATLALPWPLSLDTQDRTVAEVSGPDGTTEMVEARLSPHPRLLDPAGCLAANIELPRIVVEHGITRIEGFPNAGTAEELGPQERRAREGLIGVAAAVLADVERVGQGAPSELSSVLDSRIRLREERFWSTVLAPGCPTLRELRSPAGNNLHIPLRSPP